MKYAVTISFIVDTFAPSVSALRRRISDEQLVYNGLNGCHIRGAAASDLYIGIESADDCELRNAVAKLVDEKEAKKRQ